MRLLVWRPPPGTPGPIAGGDPAYPVVAFGHGFLQRPWRYAGLLGALAARGYLVAAPTGQSGPLPRHAGLAHALWHTVARVRATEPGAHPALAIAAGHSMGGGAALLAAARHTGFAAVATVAALDTRPSSLRAPARVPALFVVGSADTVVPPDRTRRLYAAHPAAATWVSVAGGGHCGVLDASFPRGRGCGAMELPPVEQRALTVDLLDGWLRATLDGHAWEPPPGRAVGAERRVGGQV